MKRYLSLWFPDWPLTRLRRARRAMRTGTTQTSESAPKARAPFALIEAGAHGLQIVCANDSARSEGVSPGLRFTDARARCPQLASEEINREADARALKLLGLWLIRLAPLISIDGVDGLMLEITGCGHLYGGEAGMLAEVSRLLARDNILHQAGLASTPGAASALARAAPGARLLYGEERAGLADLPVSALRLSDEAVTLLRRFGLTRIGQLYGIERKALARRFRSRQAADTVLQRLDQALGLRHEPLAPLRTPPFHTARFPCPEPIFTSEAIHFALEKMAGELCAELARLGQGARGFKLVAFRSDGGVSEAGIRLARPARKPKHILRLFREKVDQIDPGFGIDLMLLEARRTSVMDVSAVALSGDLAATDTDKIALAALADRITAKLKEGAVTVARSVESHLPERAYRKEMFTGCVPQPAERSVMVGPRPVRMFQPPERVKVLAEVPDGPPQRFVWRGVIRRVARADGPERINPEWWTYASLPPQAADPEGLKQNWLAPKLDPRADAELIERIRKKLERRDDLGAPVKNLPRARDYYRIEDIDGRRYWLFRLGLYDDGRGVSPDWYVHGLFA